MSIAINPQTKVGALLEAYPGIDDVLIEWAPAFAKLKNPVLRKTVTKVATLEQTARMGGVTVRELVGKLREATGQTAPDEIPQVADTHEDAGEKPPWLDVERITEAIDADAMLATGVHPLGKVKQTVVALEVGGIVALTSAFRPDPLIEAMRQSGLGVYSEEAAPGKHITYFCRVSETKDLANRLSTNSCASGGCG